MKSIFKANSLFLIPYIALLIFGAVLIIVNSKVETHLVINKFHSQFFDTFFYYVTFLGDGVTAFLVVIILLAVKLRYAIVVAVSNIMASAITQTLKHTFFSEMPRPKKFFEGIHDLYLVQGVDNHLYNSFPSGHSTCAFSLYFALAVIVKKRSYKITFFIIACFAGFSRIYLSQHFFEDVYIGSLIGVVTTFILFYFIKKNKAVWMDESLVTLLK